MVVQEAQNRTWFVLNYSHNNYYVTEGVTGIRPLLTT